MSKLNQEEKEKIFKTLNTKDINGVEIFASGTWNGDKYTDKDLDDMVNNFKANPSIKPYLKLGHDDGQKLIQKDGFTAIGWVENLRRSGSKLVADFKKVPSKIYDLINAGAYRQVSSEIFLNLKVDGKKINKLLKGVALLGADTPAVQSLDDILSLYSSISEVNEYAEDSESVTYSINKSEINKGVMNMEELAKVTKELAETQVKLSEVTKQYEEQQGKTTEAEKKTEEVAKENRELKEDKTKVEGEKETLETEVKENRQKQNEVQVSADVDKLITGKKILPAQKDFATEMLLTAINSSSEKKFKIADKEVSEYEHTLAFMETGSVTVHDKAESHYTEKHSTDLAEKASNYVKEVKEKEGKEISYKEALIAVSSQK